MAQANLTREGENISTDLDSIVIVKLFETIPGGRTLDVTGFTPEVIAAGHLIVEETATKELKPLSVTGTGDALTYGVLPSGHTYKGVLVASVLTSKPMASIMVRGTVNNEALRLAKGLDAPSAAKTALNLIRFTQD